MNNLVQRIILFSISIPILYIVIIVFPYANHSLAAILSIVINSFCGYELSTMLIKNNTFINKVHCIILSVIPGVSVYIGSLLQLPFLESFFYSILVLILFLLFLFSVLSLRKIEEIRNSLYDISGYALCALYPGLLGAFIILIITSSDRNGIFLLAFCLLVFGNDSIAWFAGIFFGKKRGFIAASPNKSYAGFIGGMTASIALALLLPLLFPNSFKYGLLSLLLLGICMGLATIFGDLFESSLKRSSQLKDSGNLVPGRGGFLDTFDSLLFSAPVYFGLSKVLAFFT